MIRLEEKDLRTAAHQSSKGNQLKWESEGVWYKADYTGYEGLACDTPIWRKMIIFCMKRKKLGISKQYTGAVAAEIFSRMAGSLSRWRDCSRICMGGVCM